MSYRPHALGFFLATGWISGRRPQPHGLVTVHEDSPSVDALVAAQGHRGPLRSGVGVADPADPTRWTVPFTWNGVPGTWEYRLRDDDTVAMRILDVEQFLARAAAAKAAAEAATRPAKAPAP